MQVNCNIGVVPRELCGLSHLQLLNLSHNALLHADGCRILAQAPLHEVAHCCLASMWHGLLPELQFTMAT